MYFSRASYTQEKLEDYFSKSQCLAGKDDTDLYVLCVQCFEVCMYVYICIEILKLKLIIQDKHYKNVEKTKELAQVCQDLLEEHKDEYIHTTADFTIPYFNLIATLRFCLSQFSDVLCEWCKSGGIDFPEKWLKVLQTVKQLFSSMKNKYPAEYFIKYTIRQHSIQLFNQLKLCKNPSLDWIIPDNLKGKEEKVSNLFTHT